MVTNTYTNSKANGSKLLPHINYLNFNAMNAKRLSKDELLYQCNLRITNSLNDSEVAAAVANFGYASEKLNEGNALLDEAVTLSENFTREHNEVDVAFNDKEELRSKAHSTYAKMIQLGKVALKPQPKAMTVLEIKTSKSKSISGWLKQTRSFYRNLLDNADWVTAYGTFGITPEAIQAGLDEVLAVEQQMEIIMREKGDAQNATQLRDAKLDELAEWVNDYETIAKIALEDKPQLLEKLGIVVKS